MQVTSLVFLSMQIYSIENDAFTVTGRLIEMLLTYQIHEMVVVIISCQDYNELMIIISFYISIFDHMYMSLMLNVRYHELTVGCFDGLFSTI